MCLCVTHNTQFLILFQLFDWLQHRESGRNSAFSTKHKQKTHRNTEYSSSSYSSECFDFPDTRHKRWLTSIKFPLAHCVRSLQKVFILFGVLFLSLVQNKCYSIVVLNAIDFTHILFKIPIVCIREISYFMPILACAIFVWCYFVHDRVIRWLDDCHANLVHYDLYCPCECVCVRVIRLLFIVMMMMMIIPRLINIENDVTTTVLSDLDDTIGSVYWSVVVAVMVI